MGMFLKVQERTPVARVHQSHKVNRMLFITNGGTIPISFHKQQQQQQGYTGRASGGFSDGHSQETDPFQAAQHSMDILACSPKLAPTRPIRSLRRRCYEP
jgi:hypothetical protein